MVSKRRISYQWKLFIPLVFTIWVILFGMAFYQYYSEREYRKEQIRQQLELINSHLLELSRTNSDPTPFLDFVVDYYRKNPLYDQIRITVYRYNEPIRCYGEPIALNEEKEMKESGLTTNISVISDKPADHSEYFYYQVSNSEDGRYKIYTVLPFDNDLTSAILPSSKIFLLMLVIALAMTIISYLTTRYFGKNIKILRNIANQAANDPHFIPPMDYPHDELGDITRQIVHLYNTRIEANELQQHEHEVALHAIEEKARAKRQLSNNINHELRTPIGVIKGYIDTILENPDMDEDSRNHFLHKAQAHVDRLVSLISDVSAITRLEEGADMINVEELDFHDVVFTVASDLQTSGALKGMVFKFDVPLDCKINGNFNLLSGMLLNLAKNSASYSKGTQCELLYLGKEKELYKFVFQDNGVGVGEDHIPHLFERFYRVDTGRARKAGGTGLGLPIVKSTVEAHGGEIEVRNRPEGGLAFYFTIPVFHGDD